MKLTDMALYNHPSYQQANTLFCVVVDRLKEAGMSEQEAYDWIKGWCYIVDEDSNDS